MIVSNESKEKNEMIKTVLLTSLIVTAIVVTSERQQVKAAYWDETYDQRIQDLGGPYARNCLALTIFNVNKEANASFLKCDNDMLILKRDVCPSHNNKYPVCTSDALNEYLAKRDLYNVQKAPTEWYEIAHPPKTETKNLTEEEWNKLKQGINMKINQCKEKTGNNTQCIIDVYGWKNQTEIQEGFKTLTHCDLRITSHC
jgi:hypothetical protein